LWQLAIGKREVLTKAEALNMVYEQMLVGFSYEEARHILDTEIRAALIEVVNCPLAALPEYLAHSCEIIRRTAKWRFEEL